jgi:hypothetical protein
MDSEMAIPIPIRYKPKSVADGGFVDQWWWHHFHLFFAMQTVALGPLSCPAMHRIAGYRFCVFMNPDQGVSS